MIFRVYASTLFLLTLTIGCAQNKVNNSSRKWSVGLTQGKLITGKRFAPTEINAELRCFGSQEDGKEWTRTKKLVSKVKKISGPNSTKATFHFTAERGTLLIPAGKLRACAYLILPKGPHPNGGVAEGSLPIVGDIAVGGMRKKDLENLLEDPKLNLKISKLMENLKLSH